MADKENVNKEAETDVLELLLSADPHVPEKELVMARLSEELGCEVKFKIRAMSYNAITEFVRGNDDSTLRVILEGLVSPDLKDSRLLAKYKAATPLELLKNPAFLQPGEVENLSIEIERLSGYRPDTFRETIKN